MKNIALVTGASSGIGKEFCKIHAKKGGDLIVVARRRTNLVELKAELESDFSIQVMVIVKDLSKPDAAKEIYEEVKQAKVSIDYLINNAGFGGLGKFHERSWADDHSMIMVNIMTLTELTRLFLPDFVKRNSGKILNVSSSAAMLPGPLQAVYFASKAYVTSFSNALAEELYNTNITVTALMPGVADTEFAKVSGMDKTSVGKSGYSAAKVATDGYEGMLKGKLNVISAFSSQQIMAKFIPFLPKKMLLKAIRKMQEV